MSALYERLVAAGAEKLDWAGMGAFDSVDPERIEFWARHTIAAALGVLHAEVDGDAGFVIRNLADEMSRQQ